VLQSEIKLFTDLRDEWQRAFAHWEIFADDDDESDSDGDSSDDESDDDA
jgi:hypothetical protein